MIKLFSPNFHQDGLPDFGFVALGDWGCNSNTKDTISMIMNKNPKLWLGSAISSLY